MGAEIAMCPIPGWEGIYSASADGRIHRHARTWETGKGRRIVRERAADWAPMFLSDNGYVRVNLHAEGKRKSALVHRLVASAWIPNPENLPRSITATA